MIVRAPEEKYSTAPEGSFPAVCVDVVDLGMVANRFDPEQPPRQQVRIIWQLDENDPGGRPFLIRRDFTASLHEKAALRKILEAWRGRAFTSAELFGFEMETVIGTGCLLSVVHHQGSKGGTFANLGTVMKLPKGMKAPQPRGYVRVKDRTPEEPKISDGPDTAAQWGITDEDVPFNRRPPLARASKENNENLLHRKAA